MGAAAAAGVGVEDVVVAVGAAAAGMAAAAAGMAAAAVGMGGIERCVLRCEVWMACGRVESGLWEERGAD